MPKAPSVRQVDLSVSYLVAQCIHWIIKILLEYVCFFSNATRLWIRFSTKGVLTNSDGSYSFDQVLSNKLHSTLVIPPPASKKVSNEAMVRRPAISLKLLDPSSSKPIILKLQLAVAPSIINDKDEVNLVVSPQQDSIIIRGTKEKKHILSAYQEKYGSNYPDSIISRKKVKLSNDGLSNNRNRMQPSLDKWYRVADVYLYNVITTVIKECRTAFSQEDLANLHLVCRDFANIVPKVIRWLRVDFSTLRDPRLGYKQQDHIDPHRVEMASAAMVHFGLDPGKFVRYLSGKYTGQYWNVQLTLDAVCDHVTSDDYNHIKRVLLDGCPAQFTFEEPSSNKLEFIS